MEDNKQQKLKQKQTVGGILFVGCMFIGFGLGFYFYQIPVGLFIGMGVGFIAMGLTMVLMK